MKLTNPTEHAIYAAAYVERMQREVAKNRPAAFTLEEWTGRAADLGIASGERAVELHRAAMRRRKLS